MRTLPVVLILAATLAAGCGGRDGGAPLTKDEARQLTQDGKADGIDYCADYAWYGDGQCDDWCPAPAQDPDCTSPGCPPIFCALACEEFQTDASGCPICACAPTGQCPAVACMLYCEYGLRRDPTTGCEICECNPPPGNVVCGPVTCAEGEVCCNESCGICTPPGQACTQQLCGPACPPLTCLLYCEYGLKRDANGCEICECNPPPEVVVCGPVTCAAGQVCCNESCGICTLPGEACTQQVCGPECSPVVCAIVCAYGFEHDANGCDICDCRETPLPCAGLAGLACPPDLFCIDDPADQCIPGPTGADCPGICVAYLP